MASNSMNDSQTQNPPFDKLGAFPVDTFFPPKDRTSLAMTLNNILAAPAFEACAKVNL